MIWSLLKIVLFIAAVAALAAGAGYLSETGGGLRIAVADIELNLGPLQAAVALVALILALWLLLKILGLLTAVIRFISGDETAISRYFDRNRERRGYEALAEGLTALASGEGRLAMAKAAKAEKYLRRPELTNLITAQAAEMVGDRDRATEVYKRLLEDDRTRFVGVRGILKQKLAEGDIDRALKLAEKAFALKPKHEETADLLLRLQAERADWAGARKTLAAKYRHGLLPKGVHRRRDAILALAEAGAMSGEEMDEKARAAAIEANRLSPDLIPAAVMAARAYIAQGKARQAARILKKAWEAQPHPDIAAAFAAIQPEETPQERVKRFTALTRIHPDDPETRMLLAELHIAAGDYAKARQALGDLVERLPTARSLAIMAAIERGEGSSDDVVRGWLTRAVTASRGPQWVCDNCQTVHTAWVPVCSNCHGFDTLSWRVPKEGEVAMPASTEMLPLIVSGPETEPEPEPPAEEPAEITPPVDEAEGPAEPERDTADTLEEEITGEVIAPPTDPDART